MKNYLLLFCGFFILFMSACDMIIPDAPDDFDVLDGQIEGMTFQENIQFLSGDEAFADVFTKAKGLGPLFVANSCISCHAGDGKGHPFTTLTRFGQIDGSGNHYLTQGGPQLQNRAIPGFIPELVPSGATSTNLMPPISTGLGFLDAVSDADIISMSDPEDLDSDGISGVPNWIELAPYLVPKSSAISQNGLYIHRFGKKAAAYNLLHQTVNAYNQDMGITSSFEPIDTYSGLQVEPEVSDNIVNDVVFYLKTLKAPIQREKNNVVKGFSIFKDINCAKCHIPSLQTSNSEISVLSNKEFYPYTDLLLHDMGPDLDDGYTEGNATTAEWRTPPLWGLGLAPDAQGGSFFLMHDGRAESIEEAILLHGGEAEISRVNYQNLTQGDKDALIKFLKSL